MANEELCSPSCSRKRKQPDDDEEEEETISKEALRHLKQSFENEYEHLEEEEGDDDYNEEDDGTERVKSDDILKKVLVAQEKATIKEYDGIKITPFNLDEEREEGDFDKAGNFIFKEDKINEKKKESDSDDDEEDSDEHDTWAESIDWSAIEREEKEKRERETIQVHKISNDNKKQAQGGMQQKSKRSKLDCYKHMLRLVRPDENVQKALRRLGNNIPKRRPNQFAKKKSNQDTPMDTTESSEEILEAKTKLNLLIELAHQLLEDGDTDIYQKTYEQLEEAIN